MKQCRFCQNDAVINGLCKVCYADGLPQRSTESISELMQKQAREQLNLKRKGSIETGEIKYHGSRFNDGDW